MNRSRLVLACAVFISSLGLANDGAPTRLEFSSGTVSFEVSTNVPGIEVTGKSNALTGHVQVESGAEGIAVQLVDAVVPVPGLSTGMKVRDEHMRKYIFTTPEGQMPDIAFAADGGLCKPVQGNRELGCQISGVLKIRGVSHPVTVSVIAKENDGPGKAYRATVDSTVKLTDFGIEPPSQFGVKPLNEVKVHLEFTARERAGASKPPGGGK